MERMILDLDFSADTFADRPELLDRTIREFSDIAWHEQTGNWITGRYDLVSQILRDRRFSCVYTPGGVERSQSAEGRALSEHLSSWMVFRDPPDHGASRGAVNPLFSRDAVLEFLPTIERIAEKSIAQFRDLKTTDLVACFTNHIPVELVAEILLGIQDDPDTIRKILDWSNEMTLILSPAAASEADIQRALASYRDVRLLFQNRLESGEAPDFLTQLAGAWKAGSRDVLFDNLMLLLFAGNETTRHFTTSTISLLIEHSEVRARLLRDESLWESTLDEVLRYDPAARYTKRIVAADTTIAGQQLRRGEGVLVNIAAANRDPRCFEDPDVFDPTRRRRPHLSFGVGPHHCAGARLSRWVVRVAVGRLLREFPALRHARETQAPRYESPVYKGMRTLEVHLTGTPG